MGRPGDVGGGRPQDVLETNICWLVLRGVDPLDNRFFATFFLVINFCSKTFNCIYELYGPFPRHMISHIYSIRLFHLFCCWIVNLQFCVKVFMGLIRLHSTTTVPG